MCRIAIELVWNAARWMHCSKSKFLKFWMTMLSPQVKYHFFADQMLFWNGSWHLEWYGFSTCLLKASYFSPFAFPTHPLTKTTVAFETSGKCVHTMHTKCSSLLLRNHLYLRKWSAPSSQLCVLTARLPVSQPSQVYAQLPKIPPVFLASWHQFFCFVPYFTAAIWTLYTRSKRLGLQ